MKITDLKRKDIDSCAFLIKCLQSAKYEVEGSAIASMHDCYAWVQELSHAVAEGWNAEHVPAKAPQGKASGGVPTNVKVTNPPPPSKGK
jgi:hypothetical protein